MTVTDDERNDRLDGPIHLWFGLSYSNYLVLHRTMMQSMPVAWQERAVALFDELDSAFPDLERTSRYIVEPARECEYGNLSPGERHALGVTYSGDDDEYPEDADDVYWDKFGGEHDPEESVLVPTGMDAIPHYDRGRTFIEPTDGGAS